MVFFALKQQIKIETQFSSFHILPLKGEGSRVQIHLKISLPSSTATSNAAACKEVGPVLIDYPT